MERESFIFYRSFYDAVKDLPNDIKLEVLTAITEYALFGRVPENLKPFANGMFTLVKPNIDANIARYKNGKKGGRTAKGKSKSTAQAPADPSYTLTYEQEVDIMRADPEWKQTVCTEFQIPEEEYGATLDQFLARCHEDAKKKKRTGHDSADDARSHLRYWLTKSLPAKAALEAAKAKTARPKASKASTPCAEAKAEGAPGVGSPRPRGRKKSTPDPEIERRKRADEWDERQRTAVRPDYLIRQFGYDPATVTLAQAMNPEWRAANPPEPSQPPTDSPSATPC